jgi:hypothetical protein
MTYGAEIEVPLYNISKTPIPIDSIGDATEKSPISRFFRDE